MTATREPEAESRCRMAASVARRRPDRKQPGRNPRPPPLTPAAGRGNMGAGREAPMTPGRFTPDTPAAAKALDRKRARVWATGWCVAGIGFVLIGFAVWTALARLGFAASFRHAAENYFGLFLEIMASSPPFWA